LFFFFFGSFINWTIELGQGFYGTTFPSTPASEDEWKWNPTVVEFGGGYPLMSVLVETLEKKFEVKLSKIFMKIGAAMYVLYDCLEREEYGGHTLDKVYYSLLKKNLDVKEIVVECVDEDYESESVLIKIVDG
jgi:hypothetical protein